MKNYNSIYYLLFVLLIMGSFASMAQNDYGIKLLGLVSFAFCLLFLFQLVSLVTNKEILSLWNILELTSLAMLALLLGFRVFYIHFVLVEWIFALSGSILIVVHVNKLQKRYRKLRTQNQWLAMLILVFHLSIIFYTISMVTVPFFPSWVEPTGVLAFILLTLFGIGSALKRDVMLKGEKISGFVFVGRFKDRSVVVISLFFLFTLYMGLTKIDFLPKMYSDEFPKSYFQLVDQAEKGKEKPVNGKFKHDDFKANYDNFVKRHTTQ